MGKGKSKYDQSMDKKAYEILANSETHAMVCKELDIAEDTFYHWLGRGKYKDSQYFKPEFSESIGRGEVAGRAWLDKKIIEAATKKYDGNPNMLIQMAKRRDFLSRVMPILKKTTWAEKLEALEELCGTKDISLDTYEHILNCLEKQTEIMEKTRYEEFGKKLILLEQKIQELEGKKQC